MKNADARLCLDSRVERSGIFTDPETGDPVASLSTYVLPSDLDRSLPNEGILKATVEKEHSANARLYEFPILTEGGETLIKTAIRRSVHLFCCPLAALSHHAPLTCVARVPLSAVDGVKDSPLIESVLSRS